jgi:hypothetical protein
MPSLLVAATTQPNWTDIAGFWATVAGVTVTFLAVVVALFGRNWHEWRKKPQLSLRSSMGPVQVGLEFGLMELRLWNSNGKDTAKDVEILVTVLAPDNRTDTGATPSAAVNDNLDFDDPLGAGEGRPTSTVPSGFGRRVPFAAIGIVRDEQDRLTDDWGYVAVYPRRRQALLPRQYKYVAFFIVTGSNFDAIEFRGEFEFAEYDKTVEGARAERVREARWTVPPEPTKRK